MWITFERKVGESMSHIPFGYYIKDGKPCVDTNKASQIKMIYKSYLSGISLIDAADSAGLEMTHSTVKRILGNKHYLGDDYYPPIIGEDLFKRASEERQKRAEFLNRNNRITDAKIPDIPSSFRWKDETEYFDDPYLQAQYLYSLIESEG